MNQFAEWEKSQFLAGQKPKVNYLKCQTCQSSWFQTISAMQVDSNKINSLGQAPYAETSFYILKCVRCGDLQEAPVNRTFQHPEDRAYDSLLDTLKVPESEWKK